MFKGVSIGLFPFFCGLVFLVSSCVVTAPIDAHGPGGLYGPEQTFMQSLQHKRVALIATGFEQEWKEFIDGKVHEIERRPSKTKYLKKMAALGLEAKEPPEFGFLDFVAKPGDGKIVDSFEWYLQERLKLETGDPVGSPLVTPYQPKAYDLLYQWIVQETEAYLSQSSPLVFVPKDQLKLNDEVLPADFAKRLALDNQLDGLIKVVYVLANDPLNEKQYSLLHGDWMIQIYDKDFRLQTTYFVDQYYDFGYQYMRPNFRIVKDLTPQAGKGHPYHRAVTKLVKDLFTQFFEMTGFERQGSKSPK